MTELFNWLAGAAGYGAIAFALGLVLASRFVPMTWSVLALTIAFGVLGATFVAQREVTSSMRTEYAHYRVDAERAATEAAQAQAALLEQARALDAEITSKEQDLAQAIESQTAAAEQAATLAADKRDADRAAASLRDQLATIAGAYRRARDSANPASTAASQCAPAGDAIGVLSDVLSRADARAGELAAIADARGAAGQQCERAYDAARSALSRNRLDPE